MELLLRILNWIKKIMNPQSTDKLTENTAALQRKILYRGKIDLILPSYPNNNSYFTYYTQEDGSSTYAVGQQSATIDSLAATGNYSVEAVLVTLATGGLFYQMEKIPQQYSYGIIQKEYYNVTLGSDNGKLKITFNLKLGKNLPIFSTPAPPFIYFIIYSSKITNETIL